MKPGNPIKVWILKHALTTGVEIGESTDAEMTEKWASASMHFFEPDDDSVFSLAIHGCCVRVFVLPLARNQRPTSLWLSWEISSIRTHLALRAAG